MSSNASTSPEQQTSAAQETGPLPVQSATSEQKSVEMVLVKTRRSGVLDAEECGRRFGTLESALEACEARSSRCAGVTRHAKPFGCLTSAADTKTVAPELVMRTSHGWW